MIWQGLDPVLSVKRLGVLSDFDGTLSPIVADRNAAQILPQNRDLLAGLAAHLPLVAVISGRQVADLQARVGLPQVVYAGNHGLERWQAGQVVFASAVLPYRAVLANLRHQIQLLEGMALEDKGVTLSIHYRNASDPEAAHAQAQVLAELAQQAGLKFSQGKMVYEIRPPVNLHKGTVLADLVREYALEGVIFLGDDTTDADAFRQLTQLRQAGLCQGISLGVDTPDTPAIVRETADELVEGVEGVSAVLAYILENLSATPSLL